MRICPEIEQLSCERSKQLNCERALPHLGALGNFDRLFDEKRHYL